MNTQPPVQQNFDAPPQHHQEGYAAPQQQQGVHNATPQLAHGGAQGGAHAGDDDITDWTNRIKVVLAKPDTLTAPTPHNNNPWHHRFINFFDPIDTCAITCCCPCVTFGKTHHRLRKDPGMKDFNPINPSCLGFLLGSWVCLGVPLVMMQRHEIREKYQLEGDCAGDFLRACCCGCCDLVQQDKESEYHALGSGPMVTAQQPSAHGEMKVPA